MMTVITFAAILLFVSLGLWQLDRAAFKDAIEEKFDTRLNADYRQFGAWDELSKSDLSGMEFEKLIIRGAYDLSRTILVDNQLYRGQAGYHVLTPFNLDGSDKIVLINRGWVALGKSRQQLPRIEAPIIDGLVRGTVSFPDTSSFKMGEVSLKQNWPPVIPFVDIDAMQAEFRNHLLPIVIWLDSGQAGHYQRHWNPVWADPEKSRAYAWQWFTFAAIALVLFFALNLHKANPNP